MNFGKDIENFAEQFLSQADELNEQQVESFLKDNLGDDISLITEYQFDGDSNKFTFIDAPDHIKQKISELGYFDL